MRPVNARPIINIRHQLSWHRRLYSDASTLALWSAWLWLFRPAIFGAIGMIGVALGMRHPAPGTPAEHAMPSLEEMVLLLIGVSTLLLLWNRLSRVPAVRPRVNLLPDFQRHFGLSADQINAARESQRCVVHHDEQGRIVGIEASATQIDPHPVDSSPSLRIAA
jgi:poly-beta-1,6-N-acetyl-D-glucosamine biosynthesis protein PgaD